MRTSLRAPDPVARPGGGGHRRHTIAARATDVDGEVQPEERTRPFPAGATGRHSIEVIAV